MNPRLLPVFLAAALFSGCPDATKTDKTDAKTAHKTVAKKTAKVDPLAGSLFTKAQLFAIYRADMRKDVDPEGRREVLTQHGLLDASGRPNQARSAAYERALKQFAAKAPDEWAALVESIRVPAKKTQ